MSLEHINEVLRGAVGELSEAQKDPFVTPGKTFVRFFVRPKGGKSRQEVDVIEVKKELPKEPSDVYRQILKEAMAKFLRKHPGKWKMVRHSKPHYGGGPLGNAALHKGKHYVGIEVEMKPPRGRGK